MVKQNEICNHEWEKEKEKCTNLMKISFVPKSENEGFARVSVAAFMTQLDPTLEEIEDVKTAVSEAVTNSIIHGYGEDVKDKFVELEAFLNEDRIHIRVSDEGVGIDNVQKAMEPLYTTKPEMERSGMGFAFMEAFMDELFVVSKPNNGTIVYMCKQIGGQ